MAKRCVIWCAVSSEEQAKSDKISLQTQERELREVADKEGWEIVKVFMWDGYSRWESDPIAALEDFAEQGRFEYHELRRMWRAREFDILLLYTHSRAGRSFTMQSWVVENVIRHDGEVFRIHGGWINKHDYAFQIGMGGVLTTSEVDRLIEQRFHAMNERAKRGLPTSSVTLLSHYIRRDVLGKPLNDERGIPLPLVVDEKLRRLWNDAADLLLQGVSFKSLETELYNRFGHANDKNEPYKSFMVHNLYFNPAFWGHSARFFRDGRKHGYKVGSWAYDENVPLPEGVVCFRNTHEAIYQGELADAVRAELNRRLTVSRGRSSSNKTNAFTGIFVCAECTYYYGYTHRYQYTYLYCGARNVGRYKSRICEQSTGLTEAEAEAIVGNLLIFVLENDTLETYFNDAQTPLEENSRVALIEQELLDLAEEAIGLSERVKIPGLEDVFQPQLERIGLRRNTLKDQLEVARFQEARHYSLQLQERQAINDLREMTLEKFWLKSPKEKNQLIHRLLGNRRFAVLDGEIVPRWMDAPPSKRF